MPGSWASSKVGKLITGAPEWALALDGEQFILTVEDKSLRDGVLLLSDLEIKTGLIWATLRLTLNKGQWRTLGGIPNRKAKELHKAINQAVQVQRFKSAQGPLLGWATELTQTAKTQLRMKGWLSGEFIKRQIQSKPADLGRLLSTPEVTKHIEGESPQVQEAVKLWKHDLQVFFSNINERHLAKQIADFKPFFDAVEKSPLTQEQAKAVVCFDNRVLLVAYAGSGKTSTMVAKAGYALKNGYFEPERMLILAFNNDAAKELGQRIKDASGTTWPASRQGCGKDLPRLWIGCHWPGYGETSILGALGLERQGPGAFARNRG